MDLTQLQAELRAVENKMSELQAEIEKMKPRPQKDTAEDYAKIAKAAKQNPLNNPTLKAADDHAKKSYLSGLAYLSFAGQPVDMDRLLYLTALSEGIGYACEPENLITLGMRMDENAFEYVSEAVRPYRYAFLVDALVLANMHGAAELPVLESLAALSHILGCGVEDMKMVAQVAKAVLTQDFDALDKVPPELACQYTGQFKPYIPQNWVEKRRKLCGRNVLDVKTVLAINRYIYRSMMHERAEYVNTPPKNGTFVKANQEVVTVKSTNRVGVDTTAKLKTPIDGVIYTLQRNEKNERWSMENSPVYDVIDYIYVISPFDTLADLEKWHDKQHPHPEKE